MQNFSMFSPPRTNDALENLHCSVGKSWGPCVGQDCNDCCLPCSTQGDAAMGNQRGKERQVGLLLWFLPKNLVRACYILVLAIAFSAKLALKVTGIKNLPLSFITFCHSVLYKKFL